MKKILVLLSLFAFTSSARAAQIVVTDCSEVPRFVKEIDASKSTALKLSYENPTANQELILTNINSGAEKKSAIVNGTALIEQISAGTWKACPNSVDLALMDVAFVESSGSIGTAAIAALGLGAGGIALGLSSGGGSGSNQENPTLASDAAKPVSAPPANPNHNSNDNNGSPGRRPGTTLHDSDCGNTTPPEPLSPVS